VISAADGRERLELSRKYPGVIDLLISDINMPRMNGANLCGHLVEERPGLKMLVMSGAHMSEIVSQHANLPFLPKPFDGQTLIARVRAILGAHSSPCECRSSTGPQNRRLLKPLLWTAAAHQFGENCRSRKAGGGHAIRLRQSRHQTGNRCTSRFTNSGTRLLSRPPCPPPAQSIRGVGDLPGIAGHLNTGK
jgi:DNA-binding response OmpR family regulator